MKKEVSKQPVVSGDLTYEKREDKAKARREMIDAMAELARSEGVWLVSSPAEYPTFRFDCPIGSPFPSRLGRLGFQVCLTGSSKRAIGNAHFCNITNPRGDVVQTIVAPGFILVEQWTVVK